MRSPKRLLLALMIMLLGFGSFAAAQVVVDFWHGMTGGRLSVLEAKIDMFNERDPDMQINPILMGTYAEGLSRWLASHPIGEEPPMVQIYEVGAQAMHDSGMIIPAYQVPERLGVDWDFGQYVVPITMYYSRDGNLWSWPHGSSTSMLYYNADHFRDAGLDPNQPPTTWEEMHETGLALLEAGVTGDTLSFGWPDWQFEQQLALHNQSYVDSGNGREGHATQVLWPSDFTNQLLAKWGEMAAAGTWLYGGPEYEVNSAFTAGELSMLMQSTSSLDAIMRTVGDSFEVRTAFLPRFEGWPRGNSIIGGNSIYVSTNATDEELEVIFAFFQFLAEPDIDIYWHKNTGYFPATNAALKQLLDEGWFQESPNHLTAFLQILSGRTDTMAARGSMIGPFVESRDYVRDALSQVAAGADPEVASGRAAERINVLLSEWIEFID